jgi:hypothetical protein
VTPILRMTRDQARIEGLNPDIWAGDDYVVVDPDLNKRVGRIYREVIGGDLAAGLHTCGRQVFAEGRNERMTFKGRGPPAVRSRHPPPRSGITIISACGRRLPAFHVFF